MMSGVDSFSTNFQKVSMHHPHSLTLKYPHMRHLLYVYEAQLSLIEALY